MNIVWTQKNVRTGTVLPASIELASRLLQMRRLRDGEKIPDPDEAYDLIEKTVKRYGVFEIDDDDGSEVVGVRA